MPQAPIIPSAATLPDSLWIAGPDGAGKTTQAERVAKAIAARGRAVEVVTIWDLFASGAMPFGSKGAIDRFLGELHPDGRAMFLHSAMREALDRAIARRGDAILLVVGYWLKYNATERVYGAQPAMLDALGAAFPPTSLAFYLSVSPEQALARKAVVSGYESGFAGKDGFLAFQHGARAAIAETRDRLKAQSWHDVDGAASPDDVERAILAVVEPWLAALPRQEGAER